MKYVPCWMIPVFFLSFFFSSSSFLLPFPLALSAFKDRYLSGVFCIATTEKRIESAAQRGRIQIYPFTIDFCEMQREAPVASVWEAVGGEEGENDKADSGTAVPCRFFPNLIFFFSVESWSGFRLFMFTENWKLRSLTFLKSILSLIFQRFKQKILT